MAELASLLNASCTVTWTRTYILPYMAGGVSVSRTRQAKKKENPVESGCLLYETTAAGGRRFMSEPLIIHCHGRPRIGRCATAWSVDWTL